MPEAAGRQVGATGESKRTRSQKPHRLSSCTARNFIYFFDPGGRNVNVKRRFFSEKSQSDAAGCKSAV